MMLRVTKRAALLAAPVAAGLLLAAAGASAGRLKMPEGMGGVPDIGAIPCSVFNQMLVVGPRGTRHSLLTWAAGYFQATTGKTLDQLVTAAEAGGQSWDWERLSGHFVSYCAANPKALTSDAVKDLGRQLAIGP